MPVNSINNAINVVVNATHDKANRIQTIMIFFVSLNFAFTGFFFQVQLVFEFIHSAAFYMNHLNIIGCAPKKQLRIAYGC